MEATQVISLTMMQPGQAVSLKTVHVPGLDLVASPGNLAPSSRTSESWPPRSQPEYPDILPNKPDVVMEGGNFSVDPAGVFCWPSPRHLVLTTSRGQGAMTLGLTGQTSAATAAAAGLSGRVLARYPTLRAESLRAMMVHCAEWTPQMLEHHDEALTTGMSEIEARRVLLSRFGWGVPNEKRLFSGAANMLTLIAEDVITPFKKVGEESTLRLKEMKYFELPWPADVLAGLGDTTVEMRCTLSFFVEPDPQAVARDRFESYPSHRLRFDVRRYGESHQQTKRRSNELADEPRIWVPGTSDNRWMLGFGPRQRGSLHHDIWTGPAYELADRNGVCVSPVRGWWGDSKTFGAADIPVQFSLIVSIRTPENTGDLFTETMAQIPADKLVGVTRV